MVSVQKTDGGGGLPRPIDYSSKEYADAKKAVDESIKESWRLLGDLSYGEARSKAAWALKHAEENGVWLTVDPEQTAKSVLAVSEVMLEKPHLIEPSEFKVTGEDLRGLRRAMAFLNYSLHTLKNPTPEGLEDHFLQWHGAFSRGEMVFSGEYMQKHGQMRQLFQGLLIDEHYKKLRHEDPVEFAITAFTEVLAAHPFQQGNHRAANLLMNYFLIQDGYQPYIYSNEDYMQYLMQRTSRSGIQQFFKQRIKKQK
ncbi:MAG: hypothetical protein FJY77_05165 [Candidatus Altiarchaeales archaeon]|nr:hypothetical protein [Candidatus Altiarchaeales archaeon]